MALAGKPSSTGLIHISQSEFQALFTFVKKNYGVNLEKKQTLIEGRMTNYLRDKGIESFQQYLDILFKDSSGQEATNLINRLTTNYSYFMREPEHYEFLKKVVLPQLVQTHSRDHDLRIWSAGCSAGQEAYTTAMVIDEFFGMQKAQWDATFLATDISKNVLDKATQGIYEGENLKDIPPAWKNKYFVKTGPDLYQVNERIRSQVVFRTLNLMEPFSFRKPMDLIFCRNVMIYFDADTKRRLVDKFYDSMAEGGYFLIGHSETIDRSVSRFRYLKPAIYQRGGR